MAFKLIRLIYILLLTSTAHLRAQCSLSDSRIVQGHDAKVGEFPHIVSLQSRIWSTGTLKHFCAGSIIRAKWILTAGHCVLILPDPDVFIVKAGKYKINAREVSEQVRAVEQSFVHKLYRGGTNPYDIALLKVRNAFEFNQHVNFIGIPHPNAKTTSGEVTLAGWGSISKTQTPYYPQILQAAVLPLLDLKTCNASIIKRLHRAFLHSTNMCTGSSKNKVAPCSGDSGGPLMTTRNGFTEIVGIVSWGLIPCGTPDDPSIYTRVSAFVEWIQETIGNSH